MNMYEFRDGETGEHLANVPFEALEACSQPGNVESACAFWVRDTEFVADFPELRAAIQRYGVDASALDDDGVYHYIVFLAAGSDWREALAAEEDEAKQLRTTRSARGNAPVALQARRPQSAPSSLSRRKLIANPAPQRVPVYKIEAWGNREDGWTVNDRKRAGYLPADDCAQSDDHLLQALQVMKLIGHHGAYRVVNASGDGNVLSVEKSFNGEPVLEIECASAEETPDRYELNPAPRQRNGMWVETKYIAPTTTRGTRISVRGSLGAGDKASAIYPWDYELDTTQNHEQALVRFLDEHFGIKNAKLRFTVTDTGITVP